LSTFIVLGAGLASENFIFALAQSKSTINSVIQLAHDAFYPACSMRSTAIVAARGITSGHSELGDTLMMAFERFKRHVIEDKPRGVFNGIQWTGTSEKMEEFQKRYSDGKMGNEISSLKLTLHESFYLTNEPCFIIDPEIYLAWLRDQGALLNIQRFEDAVTNIEKEGDEWVVSTQKGQTYRAQKVFSGLGSYHRFWKEIYPKESGVQSSSPVQGSYLVYEQVNLGGEHFSLTLNGNNLIYHAHTNKLIIGSTTVKAAHLMSHESELKKIDDDLRRLVSFTWPAFSKGIIHTGLREKAKARRPYLEEREGLISCGGFYKNGYSLGLYLGEKALNF
jgi:hypothetical protein